MTELNFTHSYHHANSIVRSVKKLDPIDLFAGISETSPEFFNRICKPRKDSLLHDVIRCEASNIYDKMTQKAVGRMYRRTYGHIQRKWNANSGLVQ